MSHEGLILHVDGIITGVVTSHVLYILPRRVVQKGINITRQDKTSNTSITRHRQDIIIRIIRYSIVYY